MVEFSMMYLLARMHGSFFLYSSLETPCVYKLHTEAHFGRRSIPFLSFPFQIGRAAAFWGVFWFRLSQFGKERLFPHLKKGGGEERKGKRGIFAVLPTANIMPENLAFFYICFKTICQNNFFLDSFTVWNSLSKLWVISLPSTLHEIQPESLDRCGNPWLFPPFLVQSFFSRQQNLTFKLGLLVEGSRELGFYSFWQPCFCSLSNRRSFFYLKEEERGEKSSWDLLQIVLPTGLILLIFSTTNFNPYSILLNNASVKKQVVCTFQNKF